MTAASDPLGRRADDSITTGELGRRLDKLEDRVGNGFRELNDTIVATSVTFVRLDLYLSERDSLKEDIEATRRVAMWALSLVVSTTIGAIILGIVASSGAFQS